MYGITNLGNYPFTEPVGTLITRFNNYAGFGDPKKALLPDRNGQYYVEQAYSSIMASYELILSTADKKSLLVKLWAYQEAVRNYEEGEEMYLETGNGWKTKDQIKTSTTTTTSNTDQISPVTVTEVETSPVIQSLTDGVTIAGASIPKWILYLGGGAAIASILASMKVFK